MSEPTPGEAKFWDLAEPFLFRPDISKSTMMGLPCLRVDGKFFAAADRATGNLLVKLPEARVDELVERSRAMSFAPAGRRFREWAAIPYAKSRTWKRHLDEAYAFVAAAPMPPAKKRR